MGYVSSEINVIANKEALHDRVANAIGNGLVNFFEIDVNKLNDPKQGTGEVLKLSGKISSIGLNIMSLGEGAAALKGASLLGKTLSWYGIANDANGLIDVATGFDPSKYLLGEKGAKINTLLNSSLGLSSSFVKNKAGIIEFKPAIGNIGDVSDLFQISK